MSDLGRPSLGQSSSLVAVQSLHKDIWMDLNSSIAQLHTIYTKETADCI